ncbi:hypothetical protein HAX54_043169 [Datura stramonium]|uniref:Uncharacterized protein n=1 Tax=Datura stramonium TaxID=4076 RepID=A0ABS8W4Z3_DATST|nr:hypothetical protein [Datura stramonium]
MTKSEVDFLKMVTDGEIRPKAVKNSPFPRLYFGVKFGSWRVFELGCWVLGLDLRLHVRRVRLGPRLPSQPHISGLGSLSLKYQVSGRGRAQISSLELGFGSSLWSSVKDQVSGGWPGLGFQVGSQVLSYAVEAEPGLRARVG